MLTAQSMSIAVAAAMAAGTTSDGAPRPPSPDSLAEMRFADGSSLSFECPAFHFSERKYKVGRSNVPVARWSCEGAKARSSQPAAIWIHGGPFGGRPTDDPRGLQYMFLYRGHVVYEPSYHGDSGRTPVPADYEYSDHIGRAVREVETLVSDLQQQHDEVVLFGESLGGYIAAAAAGKLRPQDRLVLLTPLTLTPRRYFVEDAPMGGFTPDDEASAKALEADPNLARLLKAASDKLILSYFGPYADRSLGDLLSQEIRAPATIAYGGQDPVVRAADVEKLRELGLDKVEFVLFPDTGHSDVRSLADYRRLEAAIWR